MFSHSGGIMSSSIFPPESSANVLIDDAAFQQLPPGPMDLRSFLKTAIRITSALSQLHANNTIHRSIRPQNILIHPPSGYIKLTGYGRAYTVPDPKREAIEAADALPYTSPEQTEDMKRPVDHRSDLYSLGVVFYEMLSGKLPFQADDPMGWVQCHLTVEPPPLAERAPGTPEAVSDVVMKLLNKTVEERYQSARGLLLDLETCLVELKAKGSIEPFPLGARDVWHGLRISAKLYGRESEIAKLFESFERVVASGTPEIGLVSGYSGIGKTSVVLALHKPIVRERGFFLSGKFDQHKRNIPYVTIAQAFRDIIRQILTERTSQIESWKKRLAEALGQNGQLVIDIIPQLEQLIGKQPPVAELPIADAQNRFNAVFRSFIGVFAKREHPLVLFLDDLQYADFASLKLLQQVITNPEVKHLLVLGAYRDNEVSPSHPAIMTLDAIKATGVQFTDVVLKPLEVAHLSQLVADTFHFDANSAEPLARLLHKKTGGNPFFANQFLAELHHENLVRFDVDNSSWEWDIAEIEAKDFTDDVVELMADKLRRLPGETQAALQLAACIGNEFDVEMLQLTHDKTPEETYQDLDEAVRAEFMLRKGNIYKFMHDRVHQAAYSLIPKEQVDWVHLRIGRLLLERTPDADLEDRVFDIVNQFNIGARYITEDDEQRKIAELNLIAGKRAKASAAYQSAAIHSAAGISLLPEDTWQSNYKLICDLHVELAESEYLNGKFDESERLCKTVIEHAQTSADKGAPYNVLAQIYANQGHPEKSCETAIEFLSFVGVALPLKPSEEEVLKEINEIREMFRTRSIEALLNLPAMTDPNMIAAMTILPTIVSTSYMITPNLFDMINCKMVRISIEHGNTGASAFGYTTLGGVLASRLDDYQTGYRFGRVGYDLVERHNIVAQRAKVFNTFGGLVTPWVRHINTHIEVARAGFEAAREIGDILYASFNMVQMLLGLIFKGEPLKELHDTTIFADDYIVNAKYLYFEGFPLSAQAFARNLRGAAKDMAVFSRDGLDEGASEEKLKKTGVPSSVFIYYTLKLVTRTIFGHYEEAAQAAAEAKKLLWTVPGIVAVAQYHFASAITAAALYGGRLTHSPEALREQLSADEARLRIWSESNPDNFLGLYKLVAAEIARIEGRSDDAAALYETAIESCRKGKFLHHEAICSEVAARFFQGRDAEKARTLLRNARTHYGSWGADAKVQQLDERHPKLMTGT